MEWFTLALHCFIRAVLQKPAGRGASFFNPAAVKEKKLPEQGRHCWKLPQINRLIHGRIISGQKDNI